MFRRFLPVSLFCKREPSDDTSNLTLISIPNENLFFRNYRIGWWPVDLERDESLIDSLINGRYKLISVNKPDSDWAYAAASVGPLHTEIIRWNFPTARWFRLPPIADDPACWSIRWRPPPRPPTDRLSAIAMGPFQCWEVVAGEIDTDQSQFCVSIILKTTRTNQVALASACVFSLIVISDHGRNKHGYLLSPAPGDTEKGEKTKTGISHIAYRPHNHQLHFFSYEMDCIVWYRYQKRGRRVYWLYEKQSISLPGTSSIRLDRVNAFRHDHQFGLITGFDRDAVRVQFDLDRREWTIDDADDEHAKENGTGASHFLQHVGPLQWDERKRAKPLMVPTLLQFDCPSTLRSLSAKTVARHIDPRWMNNPHSLIDRLPQDRLLLQAMNEMLIGQ